ncbi:MAG: hypothetical protein CTY36_00015 [Methylocystis sp.]|nr:MAG: hypothetical protein CTY36_00015 [Methylocystis sp.]
MKRLPALQIPLDLASSPLVIGRRSLLIGVGSILTYPPTEIFAANKRGEFRGEIVTKWLRDRDGRKMKLVDGIEYVASNGTVWPVPEGAVTDGASIPSIFWSVIGGPFEGLYRGPSVVHDFYCSTRIRKYTDVHWVFYDAMQAEGVAEPTAWLMYQAVMIFGPWWESPIIDPKCDIEVRPYDLGRCARNAVMPKLRTRPMDKQKLNAFVKQAEGKAAPADLVKLKRAINQLG